MAQMTVRIKDTDLYKKILQLLKDVSNDNRIDVEVRNQYVNALQNIVEQSQAERK